MCPLFFRLFLIFFISIDFLWHLPLAFFFFSYFCTLPLNDLIHYRSSNSISGERLPNLSNLYIQLQPLPHVPTSCFHFLYITSLLLCSINFWKGTANCQPPWFKPCTSCETKSVAKCCALRPCTRSWCFSSLGCSLCSCSASGPCRFPGVLP